MPARLLHPAGARPQESLPSGKVCKELEAKLTRARWRISLSPKEKQDGPFTIDATRDVASFGDQGCRRDRIVSSQGSAE